MAEGLGTAGQGFMSGSSWTSSVNYVNPVFNSSTYLGSAWGSGGGGASERGHHSYWATDNALPGAGGDGLASNITGTSTYYAGGGGGGFNANSGNNFGPYGSPGRAPGGLGGGRAGARGWFSSTQAIAGTANTGGGGGAGSHTSAAAGKNGGSGIVILKYPDTYSSTKTGSLISSVSTAVSGYGKFQYRLLSSRWWWCWRFRLRRNTRWRWRWWWIHHIFIWRLWRRFFI